MVPIVCIASVAIIIILCVRVIKLREIDEEEKEAEVKAKRKAEIEEKIEEEKGKPKKLLSENEYKHFLMYFDIHHYYYSPTKNILFLNPGTYDALRDTYKLNFYNVNTDTYDATAFSQFIKHEFNINNIQTLTIFLATDVIYDLGAYKYSYIWSDLTISDFLKKLSAI